MFKRYLVLLAVLFCGLASEAADVRAPMSGARVSGLTRKATIFEYDSTVQESGGYLVDISGSNLLTYSESFGNWNKLPATSSITADNAKAPDGTLTADLFNEGTAGSGNTIHYVYLNPTTVAATRYTFSTYIKYRAAGRTWVAIGNGTTGKVAYVNLQTGTVGTVSSPATATVKRLSGDWYRISISTITSAGTVDTWMIAGAEADNDYTYTGDGRGDFWLWGAQVAQNNSWNQGPGVYHPTVAANKPLLDMTPTASPTESTSYLQGQDGRRLKARTFNGTTQYYSVAHNASLNVLDANHTITFVAASSAETNPFGRFSTTAGSGGGIRATSVYEIKYYKLDGTNTSNVTGGAGGGVRTDGRYHVHQLVRTGDTAVLYTDGLGGVAVDVSNAGIDLAAGSFLLGEGVAGALFNGSIAYFRLDTEALSQVDLAKDREALQGTLFGSGNLAPGSTFSRATSSATVVGTATQVNSDGTISSVAQGVPRVSGDGGGVLVEESRTNLIHYSQNMNTEWTATNATVAATSVVLPDGTTGTANTLNTTNKGAGEPTAHYIIANNGGVNFGTTLVTYTTSVWLKKPSTAPAARNWVRILVANMGGTSPLAYFNTSTCTAGSIANGTSRTQQYANGWCRVFITGQCVTTMAYVFFDPVNADGDTDISATGTDDLHIWGLQVEAGAHATSYIPTTTAAVTRVADSLTIEPWKITKPTASTPNFAMYFDNDVVASGTYTSEIGSYVFTVTGDTKHVESQTLGDYFSFDGSGDTLSISGTSDFSPTTSFSLTFIVTPATISGTHAIATNFSGATYGWELFQSGDDVTMYIYNAGGNTSTTKADCLAANKTSLITVAFTRGSGGTTADSTTNIYVDGLAVATSAAQRVPVSTATGLTLGDSGGTEPYSGKMHYTSYHNGVVLTQTQHDAMYANLKQANILPVKIGTSYEHKKLYVEFDAKCAFSSNSIDAISLFEISGNTGSADVDTNRIVFRIGADGKVYFMIYADAESTERQMNIDTVLTDLNKWHTYKATFDLSELSNSTSYRDTTKFVDASSLSGAKNLDFTNTSIRIGQGYNGTTYRGCSYRNLKIRSAP